MILNLLSLIISNPTTIPKLVPSTRPCKPVCYFIIQFIVPGLIPENLRIVVVSSEARNILGGERKLDWHKVSVSEVRFLHAVLHIK